MIDSGFIFQNLHRHVAVLDVSMLEKGPMSDVHVHIDRTLFITVRFNACRLAESISCTACTCVAGGRMWMAFDI